MFGSAAPFWSGVLHVLVTPLALAAVTALVLALAEAAEGAIIRAVMGAALAAFVAAELVSVTAAPISLLAAPICVAALGLLAAIWCRPSPWRACVLGICSGIATGVAVGADVPDWGGSLGVGIVLLVLASWGAAGLAHLQARFAKPVLEWRRMAALLIAATAVVSMALSMFAGL
jgi:hypothetical protein